MNEGMEKRREFDQLLIEFMTRLFVQFITLVVSLSIIETNSCECPKE